MVGCSTCVEFEAMGIVLKQSLNAGNRARVLLVGRDFCRVWGNDTSRCDIAIVLRHDSILVADECLAMQLEGFAHELGDAESE